MKSKLTILFLLLFVLSLDGIALAKGVSNYPAFKPDGVNAVKPQRKKRPHQKGQRKAKVHAREATPAEAGAPAPPPPPAEPTMAAPPVEASPGMDAPGQGGSSSPKKSAPRIKPPTVMIKPPTE